MNNKEGQSPFFVFQFFMVEGGGGGGGKKANFS